MVELELARYQRRMAEALRRSPSGKISRIVGLGIEARGIRGALGDLCHIHDSQGDRRLAEIVGFREDASLLLPIGEAAGLAPGDRCVPLGRRLEVSCHQAMLGRILDALGRPMDGGTPLPLGTSREIDSAAPSPLDRRPIRQPLETGISALDGLLTMGLGQRVGIFAGSGVGKSTLLGSLARSSQADINVIALIGERGREVGDFIAESLGPEGLAKSVIIVAPSDAPVLLRHKAAFTAMAIAEFFRDQGKHVLVMMDSITRLANASREIGLALGEPPTVRGFPPSFFALMPRIVERMGLFGEGSISGLLTVLVDGDDMNEPVADTLRGLLDGHIVLSRKIAERGQFPAIDVLQSVSRVMPSVADAAHIEAARNFRRDLAVYEDVRDLVAVGAYQKGGDAGIDRAVELHPEMINFLSQDRMDVRSAGETLERLARIQGAMR